jgi:hypothetical protein
VEDPVARLWLEGAGSAFCLRRRGGELTVEPLEIGSTLH